MGGEWLDLLQDFPDAIVITGDDGRIRYWNRGASETFGYPDDEAIGLALSDLIVPNERAAIEEARVRSELAEGEVALYESVRRRKDGSLLYVDITAKRLRTAEGESLFLYSKKNVTELKARRDAKWIQASFGQLLDSTPDGIVLVNATGRVVLANRHAVDMFGYEGEELIGSPIEELLPDRFRGQHVGHRAAYIGQPRVRAMGAGLDLYGLRKNGEEFPVEISLSPLQTEEGTFIFSAIRDITERKRIEIALRDTNAELERASAAKDRFLASMSHELRTPLNAIIGFTGTLLMKLPGPLTDDQSRHLGTVKASAQHLLALINDLLDLAKIEAGKREVVRESVDIEALVDEVAASVRLQAERKGLELRVEHALQDRHLQIDARLLRQILLNLASNAVKYTDAGSVVLRVDELHSEGKRRLLFQVTDTGIGISEQDQEQIFDAFTRLADKPSNSREGTGLGLHLSRKLVELLGGDISVRSTLGRGSSFSVSFEEGP